jgi:glycosyltransferase involved in cell wall biosynthesis
MMARVAREIVEPYVPQDRLRLAFLAGGSVNDRQAWSGTVHYVHKALTKWFDVSLIETPTMDRVLLGARKAMRPLGIDPFREPLTSTLIAKRTAGMVADANVDAVFVLGASHISAALVDRFAVFHCSDATFATMVDYHARFVGLSKRTIWAGNEVERRALVGSRAAILASRWAAHSAAVDYKRTDGVHVVPFGANLDSLPPGDSWTPGRERSLVFVGVNWYEKGADVAVDAVRMLNERGMPMELHVVGCQPPPEVRDLPFVKYHGFLRKQIAEEYARLSSLVAQADFLIVPTRFEAFGIVFCEAAAHGTPAIARDTGGISTVIEDGKTGALLPADAGPGAYADRIEQLWADSNGYRVMRRLALARSRDVLNWDAWGRRVSQIVRSAIQIPAAARGRR